jgi:hypothetical protein
VGRYIDQEDCCEDRDCPRVVEVSVVIVVGPNIALGMIIVVLTIGAVCVVLVVPHLVASWVRIVVFLIEVIIGVPISHACK